MVKFGDPLIETALEKSPLEAGEASRPETTRRGLRASVEGQGQGQGQVYALAEYTPPETFKLLNTP